MKRIWRILLIKGVIVGESDSRERSKHLLPGRSCSFQRDEQARIVFVLLVLPFQQAITRSQSLKFHTRPSQGEEKNT